METSSKKQNRITDYLVYFIGAILITFGVDPLLIALLLVVNLAGDLIAAWYSKRKTITTKIIGFFAWISLITWVIPGLGILTSSLAYNLYSKSKITSQKKYKIFAIIGMVLAGVNAAMPGILRKIGS